MIPGAPILRLLEDMTEDIPRSDRALCFAIDTIHVHSPQLSNPMPMNSGTIIRVQVDIFD